MERSHVFRRYLRQALKNTNSCKTIQSYRQSTNLCIPASTQCYSRQLSSSSKRLEEPSNQTQTSSKSRDDTSSPSTKAAPTKQPNPRPQSGSTGRPTRSPRINRYPGDENRIDLSTIPGIPSNYRPPNRPDEATAQAKLRTLLGAAAAQRTPSGFRNPGDAGEDMDTMTGSHLDAYTSPFPNRNGAQPTSPNLDIAELIANIDRPTKGNSSRNNSNGLDFLSGTVHNQPREVLRLRTTLGRTVAVTPTTGFDLTRAFRQLELKCNANSVRRDEIKQRFHVRQGQRKKLDRRMRWRVLFKEGFLAECARVRRMRTQGW